MLHVKNVSYFERLSPREFYDYYSSTDFILDYCRECQHLRIRGKSNVIVYMLCVKIF